jgi:hypothetical protein
MDKLDSPKYCTQCKQKLDCLGCPRCWLFSNEKEEDKSENNTNILDEHIKMLDQLGYIEYVEAKK